MKLGESRLPWSGAPANEMAGVRDWLASRLTPASARYLPPDIRLFADLAVTQDRISLFLDTAAEFLVAEMAIREARVWRLVRTGACSADSMKELLTCRSNPQSWALYYTESGGLPEQLTPGGEFGLAPCSTMRNHGVGWHRQARDIAVWLVSAPKAGRDWDMDSDIGHESAHAAFAPVPLFVQQFAADVFPTSLVDAVDASELDPLQITRLLYFYTEIAVVAVRGESRPTYTRLPIEDPDELESFLRLSDEVFPEFGFDRAIRSCVRNRANFDPQKSDAIFELAAPILRLLPELNKLTGALNPPDLLRLRSIAELSVAI